MLKESIDYLRATGEAHDLEHAKSIEATLALRGEDIPLKTETVVVYTAPVIERMPILTPEELVASETAAWGKEIPQPPAELLPTLTRVFERGLTTFEAHYLPKMELKRNSRWLGKGVKPENWYWDLIRNGNLPKDAAHLRGEWVLVDGISKPNYINGTQLYENDPLAPIITDMRSRGVLKLPSNLLSVPETRYGISWDELHTTVNPAIAVVMGVAQENVRQPRTIEFNMLGNLFHPEWGDTSTWEWMEDATGQTNKGQFSPGDNRLIGGDSDFGGLADVGSIWHDRRNDYIGFRSMVVFSSNA